MAEEIVDLAEIKDRLDGDKELFLEICEVFFADFSSHIEAIRNAISNNSVQVIKDHAHTIKGAMANLSIKKGARLALDIEVAAKEGRIADIEPVLKELLQEIEMVKIFTEKVKNTDIW